MQKKGMTQEQAAELYDELKRTMEKKYGKAGLDRLVKQEKRRLGSTPDSGLGGSEGGGVASPLSRAGGNRSLPPGSGHRSALVLVLFFALTKGAVAILEASGVFGAEAATASMNAQHIAQPVERFSAEDMNLLTALDERRVKLEERERALQERSSDLERRDGELAMKMAELRDLTQRLRGNRQESDRRKLAQLDQLANVYGSMNPQEAAQLIEQLDITIALSLLERMPEKRIGQILSLMSSQRALNITKMLSNRVQ